MSNFKNALITIFVVTVLSLTAFLLSVRETEAEVTDFDLYEARLFKEMGLVTTVMAGDNYRCGELYQPNVKVFLDIVHAHYRKYYIQDATRQMTRDWIISKTAIDYSRATLLIGVRGCEGFNETIFNREDETTFTGSLLNYYQPGRQSILL